MVPIINLFDFVLSKYCNEFLKYEQIKQLKLPLWFLVLVAFFAVLILYWIILVTVGLRHGIYQFVIGRTRNQNIKNESKIDQSTFTRSTDGYDDDNESSSMWLHISPYRDSNND